MLAETSDFSGSARALPILPISTPGGAAAALPTASTQASAPVKATVDTVVRMVEAQASRAQQAVSSVNLSFQVGSADLAVRVEWRNGEVHTQFHTDSEDLRSALASQWQAATPGLASRVVHFAPPVFSGSNSNSGSQSASTAGGGARQQAQPQFAGEGRGSRLPSSSRTSPTSSSTSQAAPAAPALVSPARRPGVLHLQTFA